MQLRVVDSNSREVSNNPLTSPEFPWFHRHNRCVTLTLFDSRRPTLAGLSHIRNTPAGWARVSRAGHCFLRFAMNSRMAILMTSAREVSGPISGRISSSCARRLPSRTNRLIFTCRVLAQVGTVDCPVVPRDSCSGGPLSVDRAHLGMHGHSWPDFLGHLRAACPLVL